MRSISFDRAADIYDATRVHPHEVSQAIADSIQKLFPAPQKILEIGVGTGRIALPCAAKGQPYFGVDLSSRMLARLQAKKFALLHFPLVSLADAEKLPFPRHTFSGVIAVHVFHLVAGWQMALDEIRRVLTTNGILLNGYDWRSSDTPSAQMRDYWRNLTEPLRPPENRVGAGFEGIIDYLLDRGATMDEWSVVEWSRTFVPLEYLDSMRSGAYSSSWRVSDANRAPLVDHLQEWASEQFGDLRAEFLETRRFIWQRFHWSA